MDGCRSFHGSLRGCSVFAMSLVKQHKHTTHHTLTHTRTHTTLISSVRKEHFTTLTPRIHTHTHTHSHTHSHTHNTHTPHTNTHTPHTQTHTPGLSGFRNLKLRRKPMVLKHFN